MTLLYYDPIFLQHVTGNHPENPGRILPTVRNLTQRPLELPYTHGACAPATPEQIGLVHSPDYIESVKRFAVSGGGQIEADTVVSRQSYEVARIAAGTVIDAVRRIIDGEDTTAFCLMRPPGHHALADRPMGFCLFNNIAIGARFAIEQLGLDRLLIVDFDVHHGNGTQDEFWEDENIGFLSMHRFPFYPGSGNSDETGTGAGRGATRNLPIAFGTSRAQQISLFEQALQDFADQIKPQLILVSAGFDSHKDDPIGSLGLESDDFGRLTDSIRAVAQTHTDHKIVSILEGGYNPAAVAESVAVHLERLASG